ncbi:MerR family DNA-binding transcriptional regulator [Saccharibacillus sacchari]|uniref:MerR family DNA-binding transcriptional regulator n=1 Tax=Saccharibacillus sacchari TaxID=456493 RepID=A0ACC6PH57_9BACL
MQTTFRHMDENETWTPTQAARLLNVSTTTLRRYEQLELVPDVPRKGAGRRVYAKPHMQAFAALRALLQAYDISVSYTVMKSIRENKALEALWRINEEQAEIQRERQRVAEMQELIGQADFAKYGGRRIGERLSIREAADIAGVNASAIRHWEKEGLIAPARDARNGYRIFGPRELRRIVVISSLRRTVYFIDHMKKLLEDLDAHNAAAVEKSFVIALERLDRRLRLQYSAIAAVLEYIAILGESEAAETDTPK